MTQFLAFLFEILIKFYMFLGVRVDFYVTPPSDEVDQRNLRKIGIKLSKNKKSCGVVCLLEETKVKEVKEAF